MVVNIYKTEIYTIGGGKVWLSLCYSSVKNCPHYWNKKNYQDNFLHFKEVYNIYYIMLSCWHGPTAPPHPDSIMPCLVVMLTAFHVKVIWVQEKVWTRHVTFFMNQPCSLSLCVRCETHDLKCATVWRRRCVCVDSYFQQNCPSMSRAFGVGSAQ